MARPMGSSSPVASRSPRRWLMLALLSVLYASFGITTGTIPPLVGPIMEDLNMTHSQMGLVLGAWQLVYIGTAFTAGTLVDRLGIRRSLGVGIIVVWLSLVLRGLAVDFFSLFLAVALFGVGGPIISAGAPKLVALWFQGNERGIASGIYITGNVIGVAFALATAGSIVMPMTGSWRGVSLVYGAIVLVVIAAWWAFARDAPLPPSEEAVPAASHSAPSRAVLWDLLRLRNVRLIMVLAFATFLLNHGLSNWLPTLLREGGMTLSQAGFWTAAATAAGAVGILAFPSLARHGHRVRTLGLLLMVAAGTTTGLALLSGPALISSLLVSTMVRGPIVPILILILMETPGVGARRMGAGAGLLFTAGEVGGFSGPFLLGFLRDATGALTSGVLVLASVAAFLVPMMPFIREHSIEESCAKATPRQS